MYKARSRREKESSHDGFWNEMRVLSLLRVARARTIMVARGSVVMIRTSWTDRLCRTLRRMPPFVSQNFTRRSPPATPCPPWIIPAEIVLTSGRVAAMSTRSAANSMKVVWFPPNFPPSRCGIDSLLSGYGWKCTTIFSSTDIISDIKILSSFSSSYCPSLEL